MGCHGALNALRVAQAYVAADPAACVLVCAVEMCSLHHQYGWNAEKVVANALFADGAGAVVVSSGEARSAGFPADCRGGLDCDPRIRRRHVMADRRPWLRDDALHSRARFDRRQFASVARRLAEIARIDGSRGRLVGRSSRRPADSGGRRRSPRDRSSRAGISQSVLAEYGNMSSPTVLFILERMRQCPEPTPVGCTGIRPGLAVEAMLLA